MECNKDEAFRAKEIAEKKLEKKDFAGAKKFALKAQSLYPGLDGISQMLTTLNVYISAESKISGEADWYGILGVNPSADDETVRKQYRKLALMLHPDKNKSVGADGAFKLISEAWSLLSDKAKRLAYNQRRNVKVFQEKAPVHSGGKPAPSRTNGVHSGGPSAPPRANGVHSGGPSAPPRANGVHSGGSSAPSRANGAHSGGPSAPSRANGTHAGGPSAPSRPNGFHNFTKRKPSTSKKPGASGVSTPAHVPPNQRPPTFWTICHRCKMHYEYLKIYRDHTLRCQNCNEPFVASETAPPLRFPNLSGVGSSQHHQKSSGLGASGSPFDSGRKDTAARHPVSAPDHQKSSSHAASGNPSDLGRKGTAAQHSVPAQSGHSTYMNFRRDPLSGTVGSGSAKPFVAAKAANVQHAQEKAKRQRDESQTTEGKQGNQRSHVFSFVPEGGTPFKKSRLDGLSMGYTARGNVNSGISSVGPKVAGSVPTRFSGFPGAYNRPNATKELSPVEVRNMLMGKARKEILKKLKECSSDSKNMVAGEKEKVKGTKRGKERATAKGQVNDRKEKSDSPAMEKSNREKKHYDNDPVNTTDKYVPAAVPMDVPDPDFHNFDLDRTESSFGDNEVWAAYDDDDGMPRFYALISKVISRNPFKVKLSWLASKTNSEFGETNWVASGFYKTCGEFRVGRYDISESINSFSHKVDWAKGPRGTVHIFPRKGDVWAVYKNWSPDWNEQTADEVIHKYSMVVVLDNYDEANGVSIAPLTKVSGLKTVFQQHEGLEKVKRIPKEEMFRFSHRVPSRLLTGEEAPNAPKGALELDPAATPLELLQVIRQTHKVPMKQNDILG